jgi:hypothetical protein
VEKLRAGFADPLSPEDSAMLRTLMDVTIPAASGSGPRLDHGLAVRRGPRCAYRREVASCTIWCVA